MIGTCSIIVATTGGFGEGIVCVINLLKLTGSLGAFGGVGGYAVRVRL